MAIEKDQTAIQLLKILYKQNKTKKRKLTKTHYRKSYPRAIEAKYKTKLTSYFKPLVDFITEFLEKNQVAMLKGDSMEFKCDAMPGGTFRRMITNLEGWLSIYMPTVAEMKDGQNNVILMGLGQTAEQLKAHEDKQFQKQLQNGIGVSFQTNASWWPNTKATWAGNNYNLIVSNARNYVNQINNLAEQAVVNGWGVKQLQEQIKKATGNLTDKKCRLLARDQIGKLQGQVSEAQMEEVGLEMYIWDTSGDERVRLSHRPMDGLLCRWDNANVCSYDNGETWVDRPAIAVKMHPGQDIQCRCIAVAYMPELLYEVSGEKVELPNVEIKDENYLINEGNAKDLEILDDYHKFFLPKSVRNNFSEIEKLNTYNDFKEYFENKFNIKLTTNLKSLSTEFANETINSVKETGQKIAVALNTYTDVFGKNSLKKLKRINLYDNELLNIASYNFNKIGEKDKLAGVIQIRDWNVTGRDIFHELAHAYQDSMALKNEDALLFSDRIVKENNIKFKSIYAVSGEAENAEMLAEAIAQGFTKNRPDGREIIMKLKNLQ